MTQIGIIGFGRFGELTTRYLAKDFEVAVHTRKDRTDDIRACGASPVPIEAACDRDIVILCVPISAMETYLETISPLLKKGALVMDVCSVKVHPVNWMKNILPDHVSIMPTHPMFGPDSAAGSLKGCKIVICKERVDNARYEKIKQYLISKELKVIESTPDEHDEQIAVSLSLTHFIGRSLARFGAKDLEIDTEGYKRLMHILGVVEHDTWQLFEDMNNYNPYANKKRLQFMNAMKTIHERLK